MRLPFLGKDGLAPATFFAGLTAFAIVYHNLTPFVGVDCWWHMRFADYFLQHGTPVLYDPFAVQGEKILATYPDLFPGLLMLGAYKAGSILGLNILRIFLFSCFMVTLLLLVRKAWAGYSVLLQTGILAISMAGRVILQPDLFNYLLFALWICLLEGIIFGRGNTTLRFAGILFLEQLWVNTHPLFFYYGLLTAVVYFAWALSARWRRWDGVEESTPPTRTLCIYLAAVCFSWLINPLGWRAIESLFVNMIDKDFNPLSMRGPLAWWTSLNMYGYLVVALLFLLERPWRCGFSRLGGCIMVSLAVIFCAPSFQYERSLPFLCIYLIVFQGTRYSAAPPQFGNLRSVCMVLTVLASLFLIVDRDFPRVVGSASSLMGFKILGSDLPGIEVANIAKEEPLREVNILNRVAPPGNCVTNLLEISSCAVWFCRDKPFYMYGHAAVINHRWKEMAAFLSHLGSPDAERFMERNDIRTLVLWNSTDMYLSACLTFRDHWQLVYIDPLLTILVRKDAMTQEDNRRLRDFYRSFRPGVLDAQRFDRNDRIYHYFLLWLAAEATGNDGSYYLSAAERYIDPEKFNPAKDKMLDLIQALRSGSSSP